MILAGIRKLAQTLGVREDQAEDVLHSEHSARAALSRRGLFKAAGAVAAGSVFSRFIPKDPLDGYEFRIGAYGNLALAHPAMLITFDSVLKDVYSRDIVFKSLSAGPFMWMIQKSE